MPARYERERGLIPARGCKMSSRSNTDSLDSLEPKPSLAARDDVSLAVRVDPRPW